SLVSTTGISVTVREQPPESSAKVARSPAKESVSTMLDDEAIEHWSLHSVDSQIQPSNGDNLTPHPRGMIASAISLARWAMLISMSGHRRFILQSHTSVACLRQRLKDIADSRKAGKYAHCRMAALKSVEDPPKKFGSRLGGVVRSQMFVA